VIYFVLLRADRIVRLQHDGARARRLTSPSALERWRIDPAAFIEDPPTRSRTAKPYNFLDAERALPQHAGLQERRYILAGCL